MFIDFRCHLKISPTQYDLIAVLSISYFPFESNKLKLLLLFSSISMKKTWFVWTFSIYFLSLSQQVKHENTIKWNLICLNVVYVNHIKNIILYCLKIFTKKLCNPFSMIYFIQLQTIPDQDSFRIVARELHASFNCSPVSNQ